MTKFFLPALLLGITTIAVIKMTASLWLSLGKAPQKNQHMFLPHDFFQALLLFMALWILIFTIIATSAFASPEKQVVTTVCSLLAPFLIWWWKKKLGGEN